MIPRESMRNLHAFIERVHESECAMTLAVTGGGSEAVSALLTVPGASRTVLEAIVPYSSSALQHYLGHPPDQACSAQTALQMAAVAYDRARRYASQMLTHEPGRSQQLLGVACTAALASTRPKRGAHRCHVALQSRDQTRLITLQLEKGARDRAAEDRLVAELILHVIGEACGIAVPDDLALRAAEQLDDQHENAPTALAELCHGERGVLWSMPDGSWRTDLGKPVAGLLSGSFNPLHDGHQQLRSVAESILQGPVRYEMTVRNADKPPLDYMTIAGRCRQFGKIPLLLSNAGTFLGKARLCPNTVFVIGFDTAARILDPRFYTGAGDDVREALAEIRSRGCRFLVAGRADASGFHTVEELAFPDGFEELFTAIPEADFRLDISSTALRERDTALRRSESSSC